MKEGACGGQPKVCLKLQSLCLFLQKFMPISPHGVLFCRSILKQQA
jgi:hypothetical protein